MFILMGEVKVRMIEIIDSLYLLSVEIIHIIYIYS